MISGVSLMWRMPLLWVEKIPITLARLSLHNWVDFALFRCIILGRQVFLSSLAVYSHEVTSLNSNQSCSFPATQSCDNTMPLLPYLMLEWNRILCQATSGLFFSLGFNSIHAMEFDEDVGHWSALPIIVLSLHNNAIHSFLGKETPFLNWRNRSCSCYRIGGCVWSFYWGCYWKICWREAKTMSLLSWYMEAS